MQAIVLVVVAALVVELVRAKRSPGVVFSAAAFVFLVLGYIDVPHVLAQFANTGLLTVLLLLMVSGAVDKSCLLDRGVDALLGGSYRWALLKLTVATSAYSAFLNNTAVVASLMGPLRSSARHPPSRLLLPMCYAASIGGVLTLVGTSTNSLVSSFLIGSGRPGLQMLDSLPVGLLVVAVSVVAMVLTAPRLLSSHRIEPRAPEEYFLEARVRAGSTLSGRTVEANGLRHLGYLFLTEIVRGERVIAPVEPDELLAAGDTLVFAGDVGRIDLLAGFEQAGLELYGQRHGLPLDNLVEVVVLAGSTVAGRSLREVGFRARFDAAVVAIRRGSKRVEGSMGMTPLQIGDVLVLAAGKDFERRSAGELLVVSRPTVSKFIDPRKGTLAVAGFAAAIALGATGVVDLVEALVVLLVLFLALRFTTLSELRRSFPYELFFIIGSALVISEVMTETGVARLMASGVLAVFGPLGDRGALASVLVLAWLLTELMTNNAAAALALPIALGVAETAGLQVLPLVMAVLYGASASFVTHFGYQTNLMVMGPGGYTLRDYLRAGTPVAVAYLSAAWVAIPVFFPLR